MPRTIGVIPGNTQIVDKVGALVDFFRLRWEEVRGLAVFSPDVAVVEQDAQTAAIVTADAYTTLSGGWYRLSYYLRKTLPDGVSSSLQITLGWTDHGTPITETEAALTVDTNAAQQSGSKMIFVDANVPMTYAVAYTSNTPNKMLYNVGVIVEQMG